MTAYDESQRGTGRTMKQMEDAPAEAIFVWCNGHISYPRALARHLGRTDLTIMGPSFFDAGWHGLRRAVIVDHALDPFSFSANWRDRYFKVMHYLAARSTVTS